jgi:hypothetical protein
MLERVVHNHRVERLSKRGCCDRTGLCFDASCSSDGAGRGGRFDSCDAPTPSDERNAEVAAATPHIQQGARRPLHERAERRASQRPTEDRLSCAHLELAQESDRWLVRVVGPGIEGGEFVLRDFGQGPTSSAHSAHGDTKRSWCSVETVPSTNGARIGRE